jgi:hypothetical protein
VGRDGYTGFVILAASLGLIWATLGLERHPMVPVGPGFYPRIVLGITAVMALALLVRDLLARRGAGRPPRSGEPPAHGLVAATFATFGAYLLALPWLGFRVATFLFLLAMPVILEPPRTRRRWIVVLVLAAVATAATYVVFERYLYVLLPRGRWTGF